MVDLPNNQAFVIEAARAKIAELLDQYDKCISWQICPKPRTEFLKEIRSSLLGSSDFKVIQLVEERVRHTLKYNAWSARSDEKELQKILGDCQLVRAREKIKRILSTKNTSDACEFLKSFSGHDDSEVHLLRNQLLSVVLDSDDEKCLSELLASDISLPEDTRLSLYEKAIESDSPTLAYRLLIGNQQMSVDRKKRLAEGIAVSGDRPTIVSLLNQKDADISPEVRETVFERLFRDVGDDNQAAQRILQEIKEIPLPYQKSLKRVAGQLIGQDRYVWLMNYGFCRLRVKALLRELTIVTEDKVIDLLPTKGERFDVYETIELSQCALLDLDEVTKLICRFWKSDQSDSIADKKLGYMKQGTPPVDCLRIELLYRDKKDDDSEKLNTMLVMRVGESVFRVCLGRQNVYSWIMDRSICRIGVRSLLLGLKIESEENVVNLLPVWSEHADTYESRKLADCTLYSLEDLIGYICRFWISFDANVGGSVNKRVTYLEQGIPLVDSLQIKLSQRDKEGDSEELRTVIVVRVAETEFRCCLGWEAYYAIGSPYCKQTGNHWENFQDYFE